MNNSQTMRPPVIRPPSRSFLPQMPIDARIQSGFVSSDSPAPFQPPKTPASKLPVHNSGNFINTQDWGRTPPPGGMYTTDMPPGWEDGSFWVYNPVTGERREGYPDDARRYDPSPILRSPQQPEVFRDDIQRGNNGQPGMWNEGTGQINQQSKILPMPFYGNISELNRRRRQELGV